MPNVYIVNDSGHDYADAERYGKLVTMSHDLVDKFNLTQMMRKFKPYIETSTSKDFILHSGPGVMNAIACAMFAAKHQCLNLLVWRYETGKDDRYFHHKVTFKEKEDVEAHT